MKAIVIEEFGGPEVLKEQEVVLPLVGDFEVLVQVHASSFNPFDASIRSGMLQEFSPVSLPHILGVDVAGIVHQVGSKVEQLQVGDRVFGLVDGGCYAEYMAVEASTLAKMSPSVSFAEAGAVGAVSLTVLQTLFQRGNLQEGQTVLIHGGAGGVGHIAIQLAKLAGSHVIATASTANLDFIKQLGADVAIDYTASDFTKLVHDVDLVLDTVGGQVEEGSFKVLKAGGHLLSIVNPDVAKRAEETGKQASFLVTVPQGDELVKIDELLHTHQLKVHIAERFPLSEAGIVSAHQTWGARSFRGKLAIEVVPEPLD